MSIALRPRDSDLEQMIREDRWPQAVHSSELESADFKNGGKYTYMLFPV